MVLLFSFVQSRTRSSRVYPRRGLCIRASHTGCRHNSAIHFHTCLVSAHRRTATCDHCICTRLLTSDRIVSHRVIGSSRNIFSNCLSLNSALHSNGCALHFCAHCLSSLPTPHCFCHRVVINKHPFRSCHGRDIAHVTTSCRISFFPRKKHLPSNYIDHITFGTLDPSNLKASIRNFIIGRHKSAIAALHSIRQKVNFFGLRPISNSDCATIYHGHRKVRLHFPLPPTSPSTIDLHISIHGSSFLIHLGSNISPSPNRSLHIRCQSDVLLRTTFSNSEPLQLPHSPLPPNMLHFILLSNSNIPVDNHATFGRDPSIHTSISFSTHLGRRGKHSF